MNNNHNTRNQLHRWELALLCGVALAALIGAGLSTQQSALAGSVVRLHVVAHSDSDGDQAAKLAVRDRVLETVSPLLRGASVQEAGEILRSHLPEIERVAGETLAQAGAARPVTASLEQVWFPTREYPGFALPAGDYTALRVVIGEGVGQNWWCVVFPPLCIDSVTEPMEQVALAGGMTEEQVALITGESGEYIIRFRAIELWESLKAAFTRR